VRGHGSDRLDAGVAERDVGALDRPSEEPAPDVGGVVALALGGREDVVLGEAVTGSGPILRERLLQRRGEVDLADSGVGLRGRDPQLLAAEVHVAPAQVEGLADPQPGQRQDREQGTAAAGVPVPSLGVERPSGDEQGIDLIGLEVAAGGPRLAQEPVPARCRVAVDVSVFDRLIEDRREQPDRLVDRPVRERPGHRAALVLGGLGAVLLQLLRFGDLRAPVAIHVFDGDRAEPLIWHLRGVGEVGQ
jgi:hypothetical protein